MFWKREKRFLISYNFKSSTGTGFGSIDITCKDGVFRPGEVIEHIKNSNGMEYIVIMSVIPYKEWKKAVGNEN